MSYPKTIAERLPRRASPSDVFDAAEAFACEAFALSVATPTVPAHKAAARALRERMAASETTGAIVAHLVTLRGPQRDGLGWLLEQMIVAEAFRLRDARARADRVAERAAHPVLAWVHESAKLDAARLEATARELERVDPRSASTVRRNAADVGFSRLFEFVHLQALRRERGHPPSPLRRIASAVDTLFPPPAARAWRDRLAATLAREALGLDVTAESVNQLMRVHRKVAQK